MTKNTVEKKILSALHEGNVTSNDVISISQSDLTVKLENICSLEGIDTEKYDVKTIAKEMHKNGFNELRFSLVNFFRSMGFTYSKTNIQKHLEKYSDIQKDIGKFECHFGESQIGSLYVLFLTHLPKNLATWRKIVLDKYGDDLTDQTRKLRERILGFIGHFSDDVSKRKLTKKVNEFVETFIINKSYHGFMIKYCSIVHLSKHLNMKYKFSYDGKSNKGVDAFMDHLRVCVKPTSFDGSEGNRFFKQSLPIIYYSIVDGNVILDYEQLMKGLRK